MPHEIGPTRPEDLPALGWFLAEGFGAPAGAEFASPDVLRWKYLDPAGRPDGPRSFVARGEPGRIVGHVGFTLTSWREAGTGREVPALHMMDWLGSPGSPGVGASLMRWAHARAATQYVLGGSPDARRVIARAGYERRPPVPVFRRVFRPSYRLREEGESPLRRASRAARDAARLALERPRRPTVPVALRRAEAFGPEVEAITGRLDGPLLFTGRHADELNALLGYPRGGPTGWLVERGGRTIGFAILNVVERGRVRAGKVVDLFLDDRDPAAWHAAFAALASELRRLGADFAIAVGGTPWEAEALAAAGFRHAFDLELHLRDRGGLLPRDVPCHLGLLEADYAYTP